MIFPLCCAINPWRSQPSWSVPRTKKRAAEIVELRKQNEQKFSAKALKKSTDYESWGRDGKVGVYI